MSSSNKEGWPPSTGAASANPLHSSEPPSHLQQRQLAGPGSNNPSQQAPSGPGAPVLPPPTGPFYPPSQSGGHPLPNLVGLSQPPSQPPHVSPPLSQQQSGVQMHQQTPPGQGYSLPGLGQAMQHPPLHGPSSLDREREIRDRDIREREVRDRQRQQDDAVQRETEQRERDQRERAHREPMQNHAGALPIHQPVASKVPTAIHGPGGLLSSVGAGTGPTPSAGTVGQPPPSGNLFGGPIQPGETSARSMQQIPAHATQAPQPGVSYAGNPGGHAMPAGVTGISQGQQPILNDALSYLDQVKVQFVDQPDVYNRFLDIMKDFKSQAIDTPGVIERVSTLFAGHPNLIQGFNTFLPPGYRIECGTGDDPNAIRVTTPMGTTVSSMTTGFRPPSDPPNGLASTNSNGLAGRQGSYYDQVSRNSTGGWQQQGQHGSGLSDGVFSPSGRAVAPPMFGQASNQSQAQNGHLDPQSQRPDGASSNSATISQHQQEQRGVSQLQNAASVAANGASARSSTLQPSSGGQAQMMTQTVSGMGGAGAGMQQGLQAGLEKRGPVEFNHAISYVNKIKNRFATQPEIYKQFLEILQTYQRESKPIQDVYAQVTHLFNSAPDLLEDFKQFLPESAAHAKEQAAAKQAAEDAAMLSNVRGETAYANGVHGQQTPGPHRSEMKMPPVGNFAPPPSVGKENKKRQRGAAVQATVSASTHPTAAVQDASQTMQGARAGVVPGGNLNKRSKPHLNKPAPPDLPAVSPTLTPALPEPIPPTTGSGATTEEIAFFDRVKKFIGNKQTMNEFLKLCNLFSQDLIDKNVLVNKVSTFIGANPELMTWFKRFVGFDGKDEVIENKPRPSSGRVTLSNCRGYGPSYRLLPKRERLKQCSGRDEMCFEVLNDEWASHPTWASEDSGFVAHRKNQYEEGLHRIEEERHDYDFNIEANLRTIQLLEPIAQQIALMSEEERATFTLPPGIGGQSTAIYQRVIKKVYDRERGQRVIDDLFARPCAVIPIVLARLKQKDEEWKRCQREWEKVWREQTQKMFWKSLDHMGIHAKIVDKKQFTAKTLTNEIQTKHEEQKRQRELPRTVVPKHQFEYSFEQAGVVLDATRLLLVFAEHTSNHTAADRQKLEAFLSDFIPKFFGFGAEKLEEGVGTLSYRSPPDEDMEDASPAPGESSGRGRRGVGKKTDLRRGVLERGRNGRATRADDGAPGAEPESKETTPDVASAMDEDTNGTMDEATESSPAPDPNEDNWTAHPTAGAKRKSRPLAREIPPNEPFRRENYSLYCNVNLYCFLRMFQILYDRLLQIKRNESEVVEDVRRTRMPKPAHELRLIDKKPEDFFRNTGPGANYYQQVLEMCQEVIEQQTDISQLEEVLRQFYLRCGWQLYALEKLLGVIARFALLAVSSEAKDKGGEIVQLFYKDREREETTHQNEINYRKQVEKLVKDGDVFRIVFNQPTTRATIQILKKEDSTFDDETMSAEAKWSYYTASFIKIEPTERVPLDTKFRMPFLRRNIAKEVDDAEEDSRAVPHLYESGLEMRICVNSYKILWQPMTQEWFVQSDPDGTGGKESAANLQRAKDKRKRTFEEKMVASSPWMKDVDQDELDGKMDAYKRLVQQPAEGEEAPQAEVGRDGEGDEAMADS